MAGEVLVDEARDVRACGCTVDEYWWTIWSDRYAIRTRNLMTGQPPSGSTVAAGVKRAKVMSVFVAAEACLTRRRVPPATLVEESSVAIVS